MNWYKLSKTDSRKKDLRQLIDEYHISDGLEAWTKDDNICISLGDWAENADEIIDKTKRIMGKKGKLTVENEIGTPGLGWKSV